MRAYLLTGLLVGVATAATRDVISFDFGWKHRTGLHAWAGPDDQPASNPDPGTNPAEACKLLMLFWYPINVYIAGHVCHVICAFSSASKYDTKGWIDVQLPHDGLIAATASQKACPNGCSGRSYIPRHVLWYRKKFLIPSDWKGLMRAHTDDGIF